LDNLSLDPEQILFNIFNISLISALLSKPQIFCIQYIPLSFCKKYTEGVILYRKADVLSSFVYYWGKKGIKIIQKLKVYRKI